MEGQMLRKSAEGKLKAYFYTLLGYELYTYKSKEDKYHKTMHTLTGSFIEY